MTMKPKAKKFRIKRSGGLAQSAGAEPAQVARDQDPLTVPITAQMHEDEPQPQRTAAPRRPATPPQATAQTTPPRRPPPAATPPADIASPAQVQGETDIDTIRKEGLTGRQLRMARRVAQKNGIAPTSDFDAVRLLRERGIDPFERANMLELVVPKGTELAENQIKLPQTVPAQGSNLPSTEMAPAERRANEIRQIQLDIARRRRSKMMYLMTRLAMFVGIPTAILGWYFYMVATPLYATKSAFLIQQSEGSGSSAGGLGGLLGSSQLATVQDSIAVQGYLASREAMLRLNDDLGYKAHFSGDGIDVITRLPEGASNEKAYSLYKKNVKIGYDPTEGIMKLEVIAATPEASEAFSKALIGYAEDQVDNLSQRLRGDRLEGAQAGLEDARLKRAEALAKLSALQIELGTVDPTIDVSSLNTQITSFDTQLQEKRLQLQALEDNSRPNQARVDGVRGDIGRLEELIEQLRSQVTQSGTGGPSQVEKIAQLRVAEGDFATRDLMFQASLQAMETTRVEASRQVRYLALSENPVAPDEPTYPKAFENTALAFLIFAGIYLMISLTASILREQVSS